MSQENLIRSGLLEMYLAGLVSPEEHRKAEAAEHDDSQVAEECDAIEDTITAYLSLYALPLPEQWQHIMEAVTREREAAEARAAEPDPAHGKKGPKKKEPSKADVAHQQTVPLAPSPTAAKKVQEAQKGASTATYLILFALVLAVGVLASYYYLQYSRTKRLAQHQAVELQMMREHSAHADEGLPDEALSQQYDPALLRGTGRNPGGKAVFYASAIDSMSFLKIYNIQPEYKNAHLKVWVAREEGNWQLVDTVHVSEAIDVVAPVKYAGTAPKLLITELEQSVPSDTSALYF